MPNLEDYIGLGIDLAVSGLASKYIGGGAGAGVRYFAGDGIGGFVGGALGGAWSDGWDGFWRGGFSGAGGALLGSAAGFAVRPLGRKWASGIDERSAGAKSEHAEFVDNADELSRATKARDAAGTELEKARENVVAAEEILIRAEGRLASKTDPDSAVYAQAEQEVEAARQALDKAKSARKEAQEDFDEKNLAVDNADAASPVQENVADDATVALNQAKRRARWLGADGYASRYGHVSLVMIGSGLAVGFTGINWDSEGGGGGAEKVVLEWDGSIPATAAGVMGTYPFVETPGVTPHGEGFFLRPKELNSQVINAYGGPNRSFASSVVDIYQMFGDLEKKKDLQIDPVPQLPIGAAGSSAGATSYGETRSSLKAAATALEESELNNKDKTKKVAEISATGKEQIASLINGVNLEMQKILESPEDNFLRILSQGFDELVGIMEEAAQQMEVVAKGIEDPSANDEKISDELDDRVNEIENRMKDPSLTPDSSRIGLNDPSLLDNLNPGTPDLPGTSGAALQDQIDQIEDRANDALQTATDPAFNPAAPQLGATDPMGGMGGMGGLMNSMLPMMAQQAAMRNMADNDLAGRAGDIDPSRFDQPAMPTVPRPQPPLTTPWSNQPAAPTGTPAAAQPAQHQPGVPSGATSTQPGGGLPKRVAGADGRVPYLLPNGETQRVALAAAQALDKAFANKNDTDAQAAYEGTAGAWIHPKDIGLRIDPYRLVTGGVAMWTKAEPKDGAPQPEPKQAQAAFGVSGGDGAQGEQTPADKPDTGSSGKRQYRTAIVVVYGEGESGTVEAVVNGELQQYTPDLADADGAFGDFAGFHLPKGVEAAGDKGQDTDAGAPATDQVLDVAPMASA